MKVKIQKIMFLLFLIGIWNLNIFADSIPLPELEKHSKTTKEVVLIDNEERLNKKFDEYIERKNKRSSIYWMAGINEKIKKTNLNSLFALGIRFAVGSDRFFKSIPVSPFFTIGSKGLVMGYSYPFLNIRKMDFFTKKKLYLYKYNSFFFVDPLLLFVDWDGGVAVGSGFSCSWNNILDNGDKEIKFYENIGIEFQYKHLWGYKVEEDDKKQSDFWGIFFTYRF